MSGVSKIIMNSDSEECDLDSSDDDFEIQTSGSDTDSDDDVAQAAAPAQPSTSPVRTARQQYVWRPATRQPPVTTFRGIQGSTSEVVVTDEESPLQYFQLVFNDALMNLLVQETNRYASQYITGQNLAPPSRANVWKPTNKDELKVFFGLVLLTGLVDRKGHLASYWSKEEIIATPFFNKCMSRNRFQLLTAFLHFNDNEQMPKNCEDKLYKIRPVYSLMVSRWRELYSLGEHISIDKGMLKWRGRLSFRVYMKDKPVKYGIKSYILADSKTHYCWNMDLYHRVKKTLKETVQGLLTQSCLHLWHSLYMDNFYNSVELSETLLAQEVHTVGTLRSNRGEPSTVRTPQRMQRHNVIAMDNGKVMVLAWKDKQIVKAISTKHDGSLCSVTRRRKGGRGAMEEGMKPACIVDYNQHMSGVNHLDQMISYYPCTRKSLKWTKKVFYYLMEITVHNCFILYKAKSSTRSKSLHQFCKELVRQLCQQPQEELSSDNDEGPPRKAPKHDPQERLRGGFNSHHMATFPPTASKKYPQRACRVCLKGGKRKHTRYYCKDCGIPLCCAPCFGEYHSKKQLK